MQGTKTGRAVAVAAAVAALIAALSICLLNAASAQQAYGDDDNAYTVAIAPSLESAQVEDDEAGQVLVAAVAENLVANPFPQNMSAQNDGGELFTGRATQVDAFGNEYQIFCTYRKLDNGTVAVAGEENSRGKRAIDITTEGTVVIPQQVTIDDATYTVSAVGPYAFGGASTYACTKVERVVLPDTVTSIGSYAFCNCSGLTTVNMPANLTTIEHHAFYYCTKLAGSDAQSAKLVFPAKLKTIDSYAFCRAIALRVLDFQGDAPAIAEYAFTGGGMKVQKVVFRKNGIPEALDRQNRFNAESAGQPKFYNTVSFYATEGAARLGSQSVRLGQVVVDESVTLYQLREGLGGEAVYEGAVPAWPEGTNLWTADVDDENVPTRSVDDVPEVNYGGRVTGSISVWAIHSDYTDLSTATLTMRSDTYTGLSILSLNEPVLTNMLGVKVEESEGFRFSYQRKDESGAWAATDDLASIGDLRVVATATQGGRYTGEAAAEFAITMETGATFMAPVDYRQSADSDVSQIGCWFTVTAFGEGRQPTLAVANGNPRYQQAYDGGSVPLYSRAVNVDLDGELILPDNMTVQGSDFTVTGIASAAFGSTGMEREPPACALSHVELPATLRTVGANAFSRCGNLNKLTFRGDADAIGWGQTVFYGSRNIREVVWYGKRASSPYLFNAAAPTNSSDPVNYYTVRYYANEADASSPAATPIGQATLREDVVLAFVDDAIDYESGLYDGAVPAFPEGLVDDGKWFAPMWMYPEVNADNALALKCTLADSCAAYAAQSNDAYTLSDSYNEQGERAVTTVIVGLSDGDSFDYTGEPPVTPDVDFRVADSVGRRLVYGVDYAVEYMRQNARTEQWEVSEDQVNGGKVRLVVKGMGAYTGSTYVEITIIPPTVTVGTRFKADIPVTYADGTEGAVPCSMQLASFGNAKEGTLGTANIVRDGGPAIDASLAAYVHIPETVVFDGNVLRVAGIGSTAFGGTSITGVSVPSTVTSVGATAFSGCKQLTSANIDADVSGGTNMFYNCIALAQVQLGEHATSLPAGMFFGCIALEEIDLPDTLSALGSGVFRGCRKLVQITVPRGFAGALASALEGSSVATVAFEEGTVQIAASVLAGATTVTSVVLPDTVTAIGASAFAASGLERVVIPASIETVASMAFSSCASLATVEFEGDPTAISMTNAFVLSRNLNAVVFRANGLEHPELVFTTTTPTFYFTCTFYETEESARAGGAQGVLGRAVFERGTMLRDVNARTYRERALYEGEVPDLPQGTTVWRTADGTGLFESVQNSHALYGVDLDLEDLSNGWVVLADGYRYTGSALDVMATGKGRVANAKGETVDVGNYVVSYQRRADGGSWADTDDLISIGRMQVTATAAEGSGYTGTVTGSFAITRYLAGDTFTDVEANGVTVTYEVASVADEVKPGTVKVGLGNSAFKAIDDATVGSVDLPELAHDRDGLAYAPVAIAPYAFYRCMGVTRVRIPSQVTSIGAQAFAYDHEKTDTKYSELACVEFANDMAATTVAPTAFRNCDVIKTLVYYQAKGDFDAFGASSGIQRYYTMTYYASEKARDAGDVLARVTAKEGVLPYSYSGADLYVSSDPEPDLNPGMEWHYQNMLTDEEGRLIDSMSVYAAPKSDDVVLADVVVEGVDGTDTVACAFRKVRDAEYQLTGDVVVGYVEDGLTAVPQALAGTVVVPASVRDADGAEWPVVGVGDYAFGSTEPDEACANLKGVVLPASIESIGAAAFMNCTEFSHVAFTDDSELARVGAAAFENCTALSAVDLPATVTDIEAAAFARSGLVRIYIPGSVERLGKRAFTDCSELREAVIGGWMALDLEAPADADSIWKAAVAAANDQRMAGSVPGQDAGEDEDDPVQEQGASGSGSVADGPAANDAAGDGHSDSADEAQLATNASRLAVLDDYVFASCPKLARVVFDADVSNMVIAEQAFEGDENITAVVFGDKRAATDVGTFGLSAPTTYLTVSYFQHPENLTALDRMGYVCLVDGAVLSEANDEALYAGAVPSLEDYYEWVYAADPAAPLADSVYVHGDKIRYTIDAGALDPAIRCIVEVEGAEADRAAFEDQVKIALSCEGNASIAGFGVVDVETGEKLVEFDGAQGEFDMPGRAVRIEAQVKLDLGVSVQTVRGVTSEVATLSLDDLSALSADSTAAGAVFGFWSMFGEARVVSTGKAVTLRELLDACEVVFEPGDSLVLYAGAKRVASLDYNQLYSYERFYFPYFNVGELEGAQAVEPTIAVTSVVADASSYNPETALPSLAQSYRLCMGQQDVDASNIKETESLFATGFTNLMVLKGAEDLSGYTVEGVDESYAYTGDSVEPAVTVRDAEGTALVLDKDYTVTYEDSTGPGRATVTVQGVGFYKGSIQRSYRVIRAWQVAGATRYSTSAQAALEGYPNGSAGVIICSGENYPDALSASGLAGLMDFPLLLTKSKSLDASTRDAIAALSRGGSGFQVIIVGGTAAVSPAVESAIVDAVGGSGVDVSRVAGRDRYETSFAVFNYGRYVNGGWSDTAIIASGSAFPDALSVFSYAAASKSPVLLCAPSGMPSYMLGEVDAKTFQRAVIAGGPIGVSEAAEQSLADKLGKAAIVRCGGTDRYETNKLFAIWSATAGGMSNASFGVTSGAGFADGLSAVSVLANMKAPLLLVGNGAGPAGEVLKQYKDTACALVFIGGEASVPLNVRYQLMDALSWERALLERV